MGDESGIRDIYDILTNPTHVSFQARFSWKERRSRESARLDRGAAAVRGSSDEGQPVEDPTGHGCHGHVNRRDLAPPRVFAAVLVRARAGSEID